MQRDLGSRDLEFIEAVKFVRSGLLKVAGVTPEEWTVVPMQVKPIKVLRCKIAVQIKTAFSPKGLWNILSGGGVPNSGTQEWQGFDHGQRSLREPDEENLRDCRNRMRLQPLLGGCPCTSRNI